MYFFHCRIIKTDCFAISSIKNSNYLSSLSIILKFVLQQKKIPRSNQLPKIEFVFWNFHVNTTSVQLFRQAQTMMKCPKSFMKYFIVRHMIFAHYSTAIDTMSNLTSNQINLLNSICQFFTWIPLNWSLQSIKRKDYVANHPMENRRFQDHLLPLCNNAKQKKKHCPFQIERE